jgi:hypothetical protein
MTIGEVVIYDGVDISEYYLREIEKYLGNKWGVSTAHTSFLPEDITGLSLWLDASQPGSIDDSTATPDVDGWYDLSGNGNRVIQGAAAKKPHTGGTINSKNAIVFDGSDDLLVNSTAGGTFTGTKGTVVMVLSITSLANSVVLSSSDTATGNKFQHFAYLVDDTPAFASTNVGTFDDNGRLTFDLATGTTYIYSVTSDGSTYTGRINGGEKVVFMGSGSNAGNFFGDVPDRDNFCVGALKHTSETLFTNATIAEILVYDGVDLTASQVTDLETYLANKWGVTLS